MAMQLAMMDAIDVGVNDGHEGEGEGDGEGDGDGKRVYVVSYGTVDGRYSVLVCLARYLLWLWYVLIAAAGWTTLNRLHTNHQLAVRSA